MNKNYQAFGWGITSKYTETFILEDEELGRVILLNGMRVIAKIIFTDDILRVSTAEGLPK